MVTEKLKDRKGESLTEAMAAFLIAGLGLLLLASSIQAAARVLERSESLQRSRTEERNRLERRETEAERSSVTLIFPDDGKNTEMQKEVFLYRVNDWMVYDYEQEFPEEK